jgi:hypothetical protein
MFPADDSGSDGPRPRHSFPSGTPNRLRLARNSSYSQLYGCLGREDDISVLVEPALTQARSTRTTTTSKRPSAAIAFLQRTMARFRRQRKQTSLPRNGRPLSDITPHLAGRDGFTSLTRLVLRSADDVSFSPSSFFRTVEEVSALNACSETPLAPLLPSPPLRSPRPRPRRRPPPPVDETTAERAMTTSSPKHSLTGSQKLPRHPLINKKRELDSLLELQALAQELDKLDPSDSPPLAQHHRSHASSSLKSSRPRLWSASPSAALNFDRDPLTELLAVAEELKTMQNLDSDDILYMTDVPPLSPLPPTLHAFLDAPGASSHVLEMDIHTEDETFLGIPIPCIVVTSEGETLLPVEVLGMQLPCRPSPSEDLLAPPPTTHRGRSETDQPSIVMDDDRAIGSPSESASPCQDEEVRGGSLSLLCDYSDYSSSSANVNLSWQVINSSSPSNRCSKPSRPTTPKPAPLLRRRERSLLRRMLGGDGHVSALAAEKDKSKHIPSSKRERIRISKEAIGPPRPLLPVSQAVTVVDGSL